MEFDYSNEALFHPEKRPAFVTERPRFDPSARDYSVGNSWWMANLSHLAYFERGPLERALQRVGLELVRFFDQDDTEAYLARSAELTVLAFRGTQAGNIGDLKADLTSTLVPLHKGDKVKISEGARTALDHVWDAVARELEGLEKDNTPVWYTGHSLGAVMAILAASRKRPAVLTTFGAPKVGNESFCKELDGLPYFRHVNNCDFTEVWPLDPGYRHAGTEIFLSEKHPLKISPSRMEILHIQTEAQLRYSWDFLSDSGRVPMRMFADHTILNYTACLHKELKKSAG